MTKHYKKVLIGAAVIFGLAQFFGPSLTNPKVVAGQDMLAANAPPQHLAAVLRTACYDCHSHETRWPWYSRVVPVSWWLMNHIQEGRDQLNFSEWPHDNARRARSYWQNIRDEVEGGTMPLKSYTLIHRDAILSETDREELCKWADIQAARLTKEMEGQKGD